MPTLHFFFFLKILLIYLRERRKKEEREGEKHQCVVASYAHWGPGLQHRHLPWLGIKPAMLRFAGWCLIHWATPGRAALFYGEKKSCKFTLNNFQVYSTVSLIMCTLLYRWLTEFLRHAWLKLCTHWTASASFSGAPAPVNPHSTFCYYEFDYVKWNHALFVFLWLAYFT